MIQYAITFLKISEQNIVILYLLFFRLHSGDHREGLCSRPVHDAGSNPGHPPLPRLDLRLGRRHPENRDRTRARTSDAGRLVRAEVLPVSQELPLGRTAGLFRS
jgi:hypothetical protein